MHANASNPLDPPPGGCSCYNKYIMTRDYFAKYMMSPQFEQDEKSKKDHKKICERCRLGIIKFYFKKITRKGGK